MLLKKAQDVIASGDLGAIVDLAIQHHRRKLASEAELELLKVKLREEARSRVQENSSAFEFEGKLGVANVVLVRDDVKVRRGVVLADVEQNLSAKTFARLFVKTVQVVPSPDFRDRLAHLSEAEREAVSQFLEVLPATPKVNLPR